MPLNSQPSTLIVFDWDGTLIESLPLKIKNAGILFEETFGVRRAQIEAAYRVHSGIPRRDLFNAICADVGLPALTEVQFSALSAEFTIRNRAAISKISVEPDVVQTLAALAGRGIPLFISTSAIPEEVQFLAESLHLAAYFDAILGSQGDFTKGKVHVDYILSKFPIPKEQVWFVGDDLSDVRLGKAAGVRTIAKLGSHPREALIAERPDFVIGKLSDLIEVVA